MRLSADTITKGHLEALVLAAREEMHAAERLMNMAYLALDNPEEYTDPQYRRKMQAQVREYRAKCAEVLNQRSGAVEAPRCTHAAAVACGCASDRLSAVRS